MSIHVVKRSDAGPRAAARPTAPPPGQGAQGQPPPRQAWLDALRGMAALVVVFEHALDPLFPEVRAHVSPWFDFGQYGVMVFFLVSGYVVPISLERGGSVGRFWVNRVFRLYPLWIVAATVGTIFALLPVYWALPGQVAAQPVTSAVAHLTMLQDLLQVTSVVNVFWTLSYEMLFYLLVTAMFVFGVHRASTASAVGLAAAAVLAGGVLPAGALSRGLGTGTVVLATVVVLAVSAVAIASGDRRVRLCGAAVLAVLAVSLLGANSRVGAWQSLAILATMFAGTALHRLDHGRLRAGAGRLIVLVPVASIGAAMWFGPGWGMPEDRAWAYRWSWSAAVAAAWLTFLVARALRRRALPRWLAGLGLISYSVYLLHPLAIQVVRRLTADPAQISLAGRLGWAALLLAVVLGTAALGYRYIERPAQALGRRLTHARRPDPAE
ncbi:hypothetical protein Misp01_10970 [Microtetraspora sp. NBRC 13810]|uniref:acyltransferase family protein n=1 Tax=Microtetraspora sp. NBRC 13810 TaxID=3030990 RepID=UPI0024A34501|nr:acyltransferase [Microtetraspora sp. NBRC 13810]GLW05967.1 hypothetical protein Misp01_10970 [Microtetraspora sp. NBRC 13810]